VLEKGKPGRTRHGVAWIVPEAVCPGWEYAAWHHHEPGHAGEFFFHGTRSTRCAWRKKLRHTVLIARIFTSPLPL